MSNPLKPFNIITHVCYMHPTHVAHFLAYSTS